jgi:hypothetical protein
LLIILGTLGRRVDRYFEERFDQTEPHERKVEMYHIGG